MGLPELTDELRIQLEELVQINLECCKAFCDAADALDPRHGSVRAQFNALASRRQRFAEELCKVIAACERGEDLDDLPAHDPHDHGADAAGRLWIDARRHFERGDMPEAIALAERGEREARDKYRTAVGVAAGSPLRGLLIRQWRLIAGESDWVADLRRVTNN